MVSIIIPCYNNKKYISEAILSALGQSYLKLEVIVVNDGSTDGSEHEILKFVGKIKYLNQQNQGGAKARNSGLSIAKGKFIKFLDGDDFLEPDAVSKQVEFFNKCGDEKTIVFGNVNNVDENGNFLKLNDYSFKFPNRDHLIEICLNPVQTSSPLHQKTQLDSINGFNDQLLRNQERDLHIRLVMKGYKFVYQPITISSIRQHRSPYRMGHNNYFKGKPRLYHEVFLNQINLFEQYYNNQIPVEIYSYLATHYILTARRLIRLGLLRDARFYVKNGMKLVDNINSTNLTSNYKRLFRLFGPYITEVISILKNHKYFK